MLARDFVGLPLRGLHIALPAGVLFLLEAPLRVAKLTERGAGLACGTRVTGRGGPPHRIGGLPHLLSGLGKIRSIALARQPFELTRRFLGLIGERALARTASLGQLAGQGLLSLPLGFLLLPPRELAQLLHQCIELLIG